MTRNCGQSAFAVGAQDTKASPTSRVASVASFRILASRFMAALKCRHILLPKRSGGGCPFLYLCFLGPGSRSQSQRLGVIMIKRDATISAHNGNRRNQRCARFEHYSLEPEHTCGGYGGIRNLLKKTPVIAGASPLSEVYDTPRRWGPGRGSSLRGFLQTNL